MAMGCCAHNTCVAINTASKIRNPFRTGYLLSRLTSFLINDNDRDTLNLRTKMSSEKSNAVRNSNHNDRIGQQVPVAPRGYTAYASGVLKTQTQVAIDTVIDERPLSGLQIRVIALCASVIFLDGYDIQALAATVNWLASEWHLTRGDFTLAQTAALIGYALGAAVVAGLGDRWGRRPI